MVGLIEALKGRWGAYKFQRTPLGQALGAQVREFFYSGQVLSWMGEADKQRIVADFFGMVASIGHLS